MKQKKDMITMLLAGGQGSRLYVLTKEVAKPAVSFGGKYKIIDFPLSNCINSGIDTVGVLTQYRPLELNSYIGNGQPWDLDRLNGGVYILPPYATATGSQWYKGTANAIYQNINFIDQYEPENVLILSGDHIYKMDYSKMLAFHKETGADATIAVLDVPLEEASRFGIMNTEDDGTIYEFEEKPKHPKSTKASMGIYIFNWKKLRQYLIDDEANPDSSNDFGKNIIPAMLGAGEKLMAYQFEGYWKDVGTIDSLWEANMDLLNPGSHLELDSPDWKIYFRSEAHPPHFVGEHAEIAESIISEGCDIDGKLWYTVLFSNVTVEEGADLNSAVVMSNTVIKKGATVKYAIIAEDAVIEEGAVVGDDPCNYADSSEWGIAVVGRGAVIKKGQVVRPKEMIEPDANR
ncbi:MAG: glucose-1-phosphate adenylyltransferase [Oscillospiraceae bacterium]|nr:glucose-1-phosphate adenylyltransferase [Oscillospiraceae bacterium]